MLSLLAAPYAWLNHYRAPSSSSASSNRKSQQHQHAPHYEFGGPLGAAAMMVCLPLVVYLLYFGCDRTQCVSLNPFSAQFLSFRSPLAGHSLASFAQQYLLSTQAAVAVLAWMALHVLLYYIVPDKIVSGVPIDAKGTRLQYPLNGFRSGVLSIALVAGLAYSGFISPTFAYDQFTQLAFSALIFSYLLSIYLYTYSLYTSRDNGAHLTSETQLAPHGNTGNAIYDFFIGRSLNPRIGWLDLKYICELRPGLVGWALINLSLLVKQYQLLGYVTNTMITVNLFQAYYVYDALTSEQAILTTMDITTDGFGWMLAFGDLGWVPFVYCTQARFLVDHPLQMHWAALAAVWLVKAVGFWIFRGSNGQKNDFRTNPTAPHVAHLKYIQTHTGSKLLISGWWGMARHMNYLGDLLMGLAWCLPCGFDSIIPYFYFFYFTGLLVHRERRDEEKCSKKYGEDWKKYCSIVKYRIVPYIY